MTGWKGGGSGVTARREGFAFPDEYRDPVNAE